MATATAEKNVEATPRQSGTKNDARRVRASGMIPAVVYGAGQKSAAIAVDPKQIRRILNSETGHNSIFDLEIGDAKAKAMIVDWQYEPIKGSLLHIDLKRIYFSVNRRPRNVKCFAAANLGMRPTIRIGGENSRRPASFRLEAKETVPSPNIEHGSTAQIDASED